MKTVTHIVQIFLDIERPNCDIYNLDLSQKWVEKRIELFNHFTLPSLLNQTFQDFKIFLLCGNKHKSYTSSYEWNKRVELCYGKGDKGYITTEPGYPPSGLKVDNFGKIDTDYIAITRLDSDDLFHRETMAEVRDNVEDILPVTKRECLIFKKYIIWDRQANLIRPLHNKPSPPFIVHIFPREIYKDYWKFASQHFLNHRFMGGTEVNTKELTADRVCVIKHEENISRIKKNRKLAIVSTGERETLKKVHPHYKYDKQSMHRALRNFSVNMPDVKGDGEYGEKLRTYGKEKVDIIFLTHNETEMSLKCLSVLEKNTSHPYRLIWIDNGSDMESFEKVKERVIKLEGDTLRFNVNRFYARAINEGLIYSKSRYVVTLSNDVFVTSGWLMKLYAAMEDDPKIGLLSPLTDKIGSAAPRAKAAIDRNRLNVNNNGLAGINTLPPRIENVFGNISMFCSMVRKEAIEKVGMLDERFFILGNDDDYCDRIRLAGYKTAVTLNCFVYHRHGITKDAVFTKNSPERKAIKRDHQALLAEKRRQRAMTGALD